MDAIPGPKWFLAHSLGNMLASAAIQDFEMPYERYFMLNAAMKNRGPVPCSLSRISHRSCRTRTERSCPQMKTDRRAFLIGSAALAMMPDRLRPAHHALISGLPAVLL